MTYWEQRCWIRALKCSNNHWGLLRGRCPIRPSNHPTIHPSLHSSIPPFIPPSLHPLTVFPRINHTSHAPRALLSADPILQHFFCAAILEPWVCWQCAGFHREACTLVANLAPKHVVTWFPVCKMSVLILPLSHCLSFSTHKAVNSLRQGCLLGCVLGSTEPWNPLEFLNAALRILSYYSSWLVSGLHL